MTSINFPIYDQIVNISNSYSKKLLDDVKLVKKINSLSHNDKETIYMLVKIYMLKHEKRNPLSIPYKGEVTRLNNELETIEFDVINFPEELKKLLNIFVKEIIKKK
jgi:hypothetical protein